MLVKTATGWRDGDLRANFQAQCRSPEWKAALTVYEKYKRKFNLQFEHLREVRDYITDFSETKKSQGKIVSNEFLTQKASEYIKTNFGQI